MTDSQLVARLISPQALPLPRAAALPGRKGGARTIIQRAALRCHEVAARSTAAVPRIDWRSVRVASRRLWPFRTHRRRVLATLLIVGLMGSDCLSRRGELSRIWRIAMQIANSRFAPAIMPQCCNEG